MSASDIEGSLRKMALFRELNDPEIGRIGRQAREIRVARGQILFTIGDTPLGLYFVVNGQMKLLFTSPRGDEKVVEVLTNGQSFGEAVMFVPRPYPVSAQAITDTALLFVPKEVVFQELQSDLEFASRVIAGLCRRIHGLMADLEGNSMNNAVQRVIGYLLRECDEDSGEFEIRLTVPKAVVASRLNISQAHLSRIFSELSGRKLIEVDGRTIRIPSFDRLRDYTN